MPSQRKRIGFLPSEEVQEIIDNLCKVNQFSQSKVTGLLVEEALKSRGVLSEGFPRNNKEKSNFINYTFDDEQPSKSYKPPSNITEYTLNKKALSEDVKLMHEFIEFKYFKKVMKQNNNILE
jgi:hypothetical protein